ncbi:MAG: uracil-DNA glycosylase [Deltaproteobacteria bacterium]|nr:MAG: uracil-DNA glycosylase [Deltaproteobacteria bacterium]
MENEIRAIITHMKEWIEVYQDMGFDPPPVRVQRPGSGEEAGANGVRQEKRAGECQTLEELREFIGDCKRCKLHVGRKKLVYGEGNPRARLVFVGEGPGRDEDIAGKPFVGEAGKLLTRIIENGMGIQRGDVYICNVVKCRPPRNRDPERDEVETCLPFLEQQIRIIGPEVICTLGRVAAQTLLDDEFRITRDRGTWRSYNGVPLMPTFHPAYLLRNPAAKRAVWEDVQEIMRRLGMEVKTNA